METAEKVRENRSRRKLARMGYKLLKSYARDPQSFNYNGWMITDAWSDRAIVGTQPYDYSMTLDEVEKWASKAKPNRPTKKGRA